MGHDVVAGWYPAPDNASLVRYWDGEMWTDSARPAPGERPRQSHSTVARLTSGGTTRVQDSKLVQQALQPGERIEEGFTAITMAGFKNKIAVATDQRLLLLLPKGLFTSAFKTVSLDYDEITKLALSANGDVVRVEGRGGVEDFRFTAAPPTYFIQGFVDYVRSRMFDPGDPPDLATLPRPTPIDEATDQPTADPLPDLAGQLAQLGDLRRDGVLTDEEFTAAKRRLIEGDWS